MRGRLFEDLVVSARSGRPASRTLAMPASAGLHVAAAVAAAVAALSIPEPLPSPLAGQLPVYVPEVRVVVPAGGRPATSRPAPAPPPAGGSEPFRPPMVEPSSLPTPDSGDPTEPPTDVGGGGPGPGAGPGVEGGDPNATGGGPPVSEGAGSPPLVPGGDIQPPRLLRSVKPAYPDIARQARLEGEVELECIIDTDGRVTDVTVLRGHPIFNGAAVAAVEQWVYAPTRLNGAPVRVVLTVKVRFTLR